MTLRELKDHFLSFESEQVFEYAISEPFSWRGSYDEVAFTIRKEKSTKEENLLKIQMAYDNTFFGYKGGEFRYSDHTPVNFEDFGSRNYSDGKWTAHMIADIEGTRAFNSQEEKLVNLAFKGI